MTPVYVPVALLALGCLLLFLCGAAVGRAAARDEAGSVAPGAARGARRAGYSRGLLDAHAALDRLGREFDRDEDACDG